MKDHTAVAFICEFNDRGTKVWVLFAFLVLFIIIIIGCFQEHEYIIIDNNPSLPRYHSLPFIFFIIIIMIMIIIL